MGIVFGIAPAASNNSLRDKDIRFRRKLGRSIIALTFLGATGAIAKDTALEWLNEQPRTTDTQHLTPTDPRIARNLSHIDAMQTIAVKDSSAPTKERYLKSTACLLTKMFREQTPDSKVILEQNTLSIIQDCTTNSQNQSCELANNFFNSATVIQNTANQNPIHISSSMGKHLERCIKNSL